MYVSLQLLLLKHSHNCKFNRNVLSINKTKGKTREKVKQNMFIYLGLHRYQPTVDKSVCVCSNFDEFFQKIFFSKNLTIVKVRSDLAKFLDMLNWIRQSMTEVTKYELTFTKYIFWQHLKTLFQYIY